MNSRLFFRRPSSISKSYISTITGCITVLILFSICMCTAQFAYSEDLKIQTRRQSRVNYISKDKVYPYNIFAMNSTDGWGFIGGVNGNNGGIKIADAPQRPGKKALMFFSTANTNSSEWLAWIYPLMPYLRVEGMKELVFDAYLFEPLKFSLTVRCGTQQDQAMLPITWSQIPDAPIGKWYEVRIPVYQTRATFDKLQIDYFTQDRGVQHGKPFRFMIMNMRFEPEPKPWIQEPMIVIKRGDTGLPCGVAFVQNVEILDKDSLKLKAEFSGLTSGKDYTVVVEAEYADGKKKTWDGKFRYLSPAVAANLEIPGINISGMKKASLSVCVLQDDATIAKSEQPTEIQLYSTTNFQDSIKSLAAKADKLQSAIEKRRAEKMDVAEASITYNAAKIFINKYIPDDFNRQRAFGIAMHEIELVNRLIDEADAKLKSAMPLSEVMTATEYDPTVPLQIRNGWIYQNDKPITLIGPLTWGDGESLGQNAISMAAGLGFNSVVVETGMNEWMDYTDGLARVSRYLQEAKDKKLAANLLLAGHYATKKRDNDNATGHVGLPWNILNPQTDALFNQWYQMMIPLLKKYPNLVTLGMANEPDYGVRPGARFFGEAFRKNAQQKHGTITRANSCWKTQFKSFDDVSVESVFTAMPESIGLKREWADFIQDNVVTFFIKRKGVLERNLPGRPVWIKLMGIVGYENFDEERSLLHNQSIIGTDGDKPLWMDLLKSIRPELPIANAEWHMGGKYDENVAELQNNMFTTAYRGIAIGMIWVWSRADWNNLSNGLEQSMTRYPLTLDGIACTSLKIRRHVSVMQALGNLTGGRARILYNLQAQLGDDNYKPDLEKIYDMFRCNTSGVRFLTRNMLGTADLNKLEFMATVNLKATDENAAKKLVDWVRNGGTLWVLRAGKITDYYEREITADKAFEEAISKDGEHKFGKGYILTGSGIIPDKKFFDGPFALNADGSINRQIEIRKTNVGKTPWISIVNVSGKPQKVQIDLGKDFTTQWDSWTAKRVDIHGNYEFAPWEVRLIRPADAGNPAVGK